MPHIEMPMNTAHQHAANAEEYLSSGLLVLAEQEHANAAEAYMAAVERSNDESAKRTLRMLYNEHRKACKELQRRIEKLKEEGKDPALPQKPDPPQHSVTRMSSHVHPGGIRSAPSPPPHRTITELQNTVDESFMLLGGQRSDPGDAFNQFWNIMQGMLDNLSQPVAFATAPLGNTEDTNIPSADTQTSTHSQQNVKRDGSLSSDTDVEEPMLSRFTRRIGIGRDGKKVGRSTTGKNTSKAPLHDEELDDGDFDEGDDLSGSFCLIPSGDDPSPLALKKENASLKAEMETMKKRLETTERVLQLRKEQDTHLRDSIFQATREAQRAMGASMIAPRPGVDLSVLNLNVPIPGIATGREAQYARRIKELEEEVRTVRSENEKHKIMIAKFRERWEKLKESAKRKKDAKAAAAEAATSSVRERIVEEPEAEEELDEASVQ